MSCYYNEWDSYTAQWLRNLIKAGLLPERDVDERSITEVKPCDLRGYDQCHFFAGTGAWSLALRLAGIPDDFPLWTGSCPCGPFPQQEPEGDSTTPGTSGPTGSSLSNRYDLRLSSASRSLPLSHTVGSTLFVMTYKESHTPAGRKFYRLAASALRTNGIASSGRAFWTTPTASQQSTKYKQGGTCTEAQAALWLTPVANDRGSGKALRMLSDQAKITGWQTPTSNGVNLMGSKAAEKERLRRIARGDTPSSCLAADAHLAAWYTPTTGDRHHETEAHHKIKPYANLGTQARLASWGTPMANESPAGTKGC